MVFRCNGIAQVVCTGLCLGSLFLLAVGTFLTHRAFKTLIPAIVDMPENLKVGLDTVLQFDALEASAAKVKNLSSEALAKCGTNPAIGGCGAGVPLLDLTPHDVSAQVDGISDTFTDVLDAIQKVTTDKYLGIEDFQATADRLNTMKAELEKLKGEDSNGTIVCSAINEGFCPLYENGGEIVSQISEVKEAIEKITDNDAVKQFEESSNRLDGLYIIPYIGWLGVAFYLCFFATGNVLTICRGGSCGACIACSCHTLFFTIFFIIAIGIAAASIFASVMARDFAIDDPFPGKPTIEELVDHIQDAFPDFYALVLEDFIDGLKSVRGAFLVNGVACILLSVHTIGSCCCGIYNEAKASQ